MNNKGLIKEIFVMTLADAITVIAVFFFLVPSHTSISSISGLGIILPHFIPLPLSVITMALNIFLLMLLFGGIILDKMGVRFTGIMACGLMVGGALLKAYAVSPLFPEGGMLFGFKTQMWMAGLGFAIFGMGAEICGPYRK